MEWQVINGVNFNVEWVSTLTQTEFVQYCADNSILSESQAKEAYKILYKKK